MKVKQCHCGEGFTWVGYGFEIPNSDEGCLWRVTCSHCGIVVKGKRKRRTIKAWNKVQEES
jgi:hypothetical protein